MKDLGAAKGEARYEHVIRPEGQATEGSAELANTVHVFISSVFANFG